MTLNLYFPGNSPLNKGELEEFEKALKDSKYNVHPHAWEHWTDESKAFDVDNEFNRLYSTLKSEDGFNSYGVLAKSIGTYFTVEFISRMFIQPKYIVLMGIPTGIEEEKLQRFNLALKNSNAKIYIVENDKDPYSDLNKVKELLKGIDYELITKSADNHQYSYSSEILNLIKQYQ